jgi:hypothetical protein
MTTATLKPASMSDVQRHAAQIWQPGYQTVDDILGHPASLSILPLCDPTYGKPASQTITAKDFHASGSGPAVWTWREGSGETASTWPAFDGHKDLADGDLVPYLYQGFMPYVQLNGSDEGLSTPDTAYWSFAQGAFSFACWISLEPSDAYGTLFSKYDSTTGSELREYLMDFSSGSEPRISVWDESANAKIGRSDATALAGDVWNHLLFTWNGTGANSGIDIYLNGTAVDDTNVSTGTFAGAEDLATITRFGYHMGTSDVGVGYIKAKIAGACCGPTSWAAQATAEQITSLYDYQRTLLGLT